MKKIKLSIITINLNNIAGLKRTIESVITQPSSSHEHIIIDGNSTDGSKEFISQYANMPNNHLTYWISEKDHGVYNAMNKGIKYAQGQYLLFLNSGDFLKENVLREVEEKLDGTDLIYGNLFIIPQQGEMWLQNFPPPPINIQMFLSPTFYLPHPATFIRKELFDNEQYTENYKIASDWEFWIKCIILKNCSIKYINIAISYFSEGGISSDPILGAKEREHILNKLFSPQILENISRLIEFEESPLYESFNIIKQTSKHFQRKMNRLMLLCYKIHCILTTNSPSKK